MLDQLKQQAEELTEQLTIEGEKKANSILGKAYSGVIFQLITLVKITNQRLTLLESAINGK
jgi:hypothetical protein